MRRTAIISLGALVALVAAALATAAVFTASGISATTATLTSTQASDVRNRTCTGADGKAFAITDGTYVGAADFSNPASDLDGPLTIRARTVIDTTNPAAKLGYVEGWFKIKDDDTRVSGRFGGTLDKDGKLAGFLLGGSHGSHARVLGTLSGTFSPASGFVGAASLGSGTITSQAIIAGPVCRNSKSDNKREDKANSDHKSGSDTTPGAPARPVFVEGDVTGLTTVAPLTITVTPRKGDAKTCAIDSSSPSTTQFPVGTKDVEMKCELVGTPTAVPTLRAIRKHS